VATPTLKTLVWSALALVAGGALVALATRGEPSGTGLARFEAAGPMVRLPPERVTTVEVNGAEGRWRFVRTAAGGWTVAPGSLPGAADLGAQVEKGLRYLHASAPQRVLDRDEVRAARLAEMGLDPPRLTITVYSAAGIAFAVNLGGPNPQGLARYASVVGSDEVLLLNRYVCEPWDRAVTAP
jgi:hypothetical protein